MSLRSNLHALVLGALFSAIGFSYALATHTASSRVVLISSGLVGQDNGQLRFTNVFLDVPGLGPHTDPIRFPGGGDAQADPDGFTLGDANIGDVETDTGRFTRYITAAGGVPPYRFQSTAGLPIADNRSTVLLDRSGCLSGIAETAPAFTTPGDATTGYLSLTVEVFDAIGTRRTGAFYVFLDRIATFDLMDDQLNGGSVSLPYISKVEAVNGIEGREGFPGLAAEDRPNGGKLTYLPNDGNHPFSTMPGAIGASGSKTLPPPHLPVRVIKNGVATAFTRLEDVGLSMTLDGTVYGRPIFSGTLQLDVLAFDAKLLPPAVAPAVNPQRVERTLSFEIGGNDKFAPNTTYNVGQSYGDLSIMQCTIRTEDVPTTNDHTLMLTALFNPNGQFGGDFRQDRFFSLRIGQMEYRIKMEKEPFGSLMPDGTRMEVEMNTILGTLVVKIQAATFKWPFGALLVPENNPKRLAIGIGVGNMFQTAEVLHLFNRQAGLRRILTYAYGNSVRTPPGITARPGTANRSLGGTFMMTTVRGKNNNDIAGARGNNWFINFLIAPQLTIDNPAAVGQGVGGFDQIFMAPQGGGSNPGIDVPRTVGVRIGTWKQNWVSTDPQVSMKSTPTQTVIAFPELNTGVQLLVLSNRTFRGKLVTHPIAGDTGFPRTSIPPATIRATSALAFGLDLLRTSPGITPSTAFDFHGEYGRALFGEGLKPPQNPFNPEKQGVWYERPPGQIKNVDSFPPVE